MVDSNALAGEPVATVENAADRQFGPEFEDIHILSNAQVAVILQVSARSAVTRDEEVNEVYRKTQKYVERFNTMTNPEKDHQELVEELDNLQEYVLEKHHDQYLLYANLWNICFCPLAPCQLFEKTSVRRTTWHYTVLKFLL